MTNAPRATLLLPLAYVLHVLEEWFGDFPAWTDVALGNEISVERFVAINSVAFPILLLATVAALRSPRLAWIAAALAALFGLNGILHVLATLGMGLYAPGVLSGLLIYLPLSAHILWRSTALLRPDVLQRAVVVGVLVHGIVSAIAFL